MAAVVRPVAAAGQHPWRSLHDGVPLGAQDVTPAPGAAAVGG
ncbi:MULTISPECIES: hypothetical protein [unclassified Streptomyces]|nr:MULTISPECIES: hypothetical protein [unclassified Streptomyces]WPO70093.1 hypothetical protein R9806_05345 [Streptomyces sp. KN37]